MPDRRRPLPEDVPLPLGELPEVLPPPAPPPPPAGGIEPLMHPDEVDRILGVHRRTLRRMHRAGLLLHVKVGGKVMYRRGDVENYLNQLTFDV